MNQKTITTTIALLVATMAWGGGCNNFSKQTQAPAGQNGLTEPKSKITNFAECAAAGNPVMESYPRQCRTNGQNFVEQINQQILCAKEQRNMDVCAQIYEPVCAKVEAVCKKTPCLPAEITFSNSCEACRIPGVLSYTPGECRNKK